MSSTLHTEIIHSRQQEAATRELYVRHAHEASVLARRGRKSIRRRSVGAIAALAAVGLCIAVATTASASAHASAARFAADNAKSHSVKFSGLIETLSSTGAVAVPGTTETDSGILDGKVSGRTVGRAAFYQTSTWGPGLTLVGSGRVFNPLGSIKFNAAATWTVDPNATESYTGKLKITGGTGLYRNAHGTAKVAGNAPADGNSHAATISITGKITY